MNFGDSIINIFGIPVVLKSKNEVVDWCVERLVQNKKTWIVTANPEILLRARSDNNFKENILSADLITPDGAGICWATNFISQTKNIQKKGKIIKLFFFTLWSIFFHGHSNEIFSERIAGADLLWDLVQVARDLNVRVYLIGGKNCTAQKVAMRIRTAFLGINIEAFTQEHVATPNSCFALQNELEKFRPAIVFVAYGSPKQEEWIFHNLHQYSSVLLAMGVGGAFDFIAGNTKRAPLRLQNHALEWIWRLYQRPARLIRVLRAVVIFPLIILLSRLKKRDY